MPITKLAPTYTFTEDRLAELRAVVPEAFADGQIHWDILREALGEHLEDPDAEHFGLFWPGKREARRLASLPSKGTLVPVPGEGVDEETTRNIFIEGENLEVLKLLQKSYAGRVKMIYIDPPYNTGNDFIYTDDFTEPLESYLRRTGQATEEGLLTSNPRASGRFHSNWLSMMYPRLRVARHLMRQDAVIFVTIDDNEVHNLRQLMNEVFGEENFVATIVWQKVFARKNKAIISDSHDYVLVYARDIGQWERNLLPRTTDQLDVFKNPDDDPRGPWQSVAFSVQSEDSQKRKAYRYPITLPNGTQVMPPTGRHWNGLPGRFISLRDEGRIWFGPNGDRPPRLKVYLSEVQQGIVPDTWWSYDDVGHNQEAKKEILELFPGDEPFSTPKPTRLLRRMLQIATDPSSGDLVLDFFAGSATTADAVLRLNSEDGGNRQFVMIQIPEETVDPDYPTVALIGRERIKRAIAHMTADAQARLDLHPDQDLGFRCYFLDRSHFKAWRDYDGHDVDRVQTLFDQFESPLVDGWQPQDLLTEILLIEGFPLDSAVTPQPAFSHNTVYLVTSDSHEHRLFICLDPAVHGATVSQLDLTADDVFVCLDAALTDQSKMRLSDACNLKVI